MPPAEAAGFNVNPEVTLSPLPATYKSTSEAFGCPDGFAGKFTFTALLTNKTTSAAMPGVTVRVLILSNGNLMLNPQTGATGGAGAEMTVPQTGQYADGLLSAGESVNVPFVVCLKNFQPFQFFVDVFGIVTRLVSVDRNGNASSLSWGPAINGDGRFVAFWSRDSLVAPDTDDYVDMFVRDLQTRTTTLVTVNWTGTDSGNNTARGEELSLQKPAISTNGRFVAFTSIASDLVATDTNNNRDVFVRDLQTKTTTLVSVSRAGTDSGNNRSENPVISADGRFVAFVSYASDLVAAVTAGPGPNVFVRDLQAGTTVLASVDQAGNAGRGLGPVISADGRFVAFVGVLGTANWQVFVRDLQMGTTSLVSVNRFGTGVGNAGSSPDSSLAISANGRFVAFPSLSSDLVPTDTNNTVDVFVRDLQTGTTTLVSVNLAGINGGDDQSIKPVITPDGRFVAFHSHANDLVAADTTRAPRGAIWEPDVFVRDLQTKTTTLVSVNQAGTNSGNAPSIAPVAISADGRFVAFISLATDLVVSADTLAMDVFVRDLQTKTTTLVSVNRAGTASGNGHSSEPVMSADGRFVAFMSYASDLLAADSNVPNVFVRPVP
jgi:Tol biopolymer transport system component